VDKPQVSIVIPLYNESAVFESLIARLNALNTHISESFEVILIDDGSTDNTAHLMKEIAHKDERYHCIFLSRNMGHQAALSAGLQYVEASEAVITMDGDLQDPPELIKDFLSKFKEGYDVVYAVRSVRKESFLKRFCYWLFYRVQSLLVNIPIPLDSGDFAMISRRVVDHMNSMPEHNRFLRGMRSWVGFKQVGLKYERDSRAAGKTKYSFRNLLKLAFDGIFSFTNVPLRFITIIGLFAMCISLAYVTFMIVIKLRYGDVPKGFTTLIVAMTFLSSVQLISLGIIGEYLFRIFTEVKNRPHFIISERIKGKSRING